MYGKLPVTQKEKAPLCIPASKEKKKKKKDPEYYHTVWITVNREFPNLFIPGLNELSFLCLSADGL